LLSVVAEDSEDDVAVDAATLVAGFERVTFGPPLIVGGFTTEGDAVVEGDDVTDGVLTEVDCPYT